MKNPGGNMKVMDYPEDEREEDIASLWESEKLAVLASSNHGHPYTTLIFYATTDDRKTVVFFIHRGSNTYNNLKSDGRASLLVDSRERIAGSFPDVECLRVSGVAWEIKNENEHAKLRRVFMAKNPEMSAFADDPNTALFKLTVSSLNYVADYEELHRLGQPTTEK